jgi:hypothetical protein
MTQTAQQLGFGSGAIEQVTTAIGRIGNDLDGEVLIEEEITALIDVRVAPYPEHAHDLVLFE